MENINMTELILNTLNTLFSNLYQSIDSTIYQFLDDMVFIDTEMISSSFYQNILDASSGSLITIANAFVFGFILYYALSYLFSHLTYSPVQNPKQFIFKIIIVVILMNSSYYLCTEILNFNHIFSELLREVGENITHDEISFEHFIERINTEVLDKNQTVSLFSLDGLMKTFTSFQFINILFSYALRYLMLQVFLLLSPFAFLTLILPSSSWIFKSWIRNLFSLLMIQHIATILMMITFSLDFSSHQVFTKILLVSSTYTLYRANLLTREILGGVSTNMNVVNSFQTPKSS